GCAATGGTERPGAVRCEAAAPGSPQEGAHRVVVAADGPVVAECYVIERQASGGARGIVRRSEDPAAPGRTDLAADAVPRVAAASAGFVVLERTVGDRGHIAIEQATSVAAARAAAAAAGVRV